MIKYILFFTLNAFIYNTALSNNRLDYSSMDSWYQHPKKDGNPLKNNRLPEFEVKSADVFYLHPTTRNLAIGINSSSSFDKHGVSIAMFNQVSAFEGIGDIYVPVYRQVEQHVLTMKNLTRKKRSMDSAYVDIKAAFEKYLITWNKGKPIIIVAHSQGSFHALRLLEDYFDNNDSIDLVAAYIVGYPVPTDMFSRVFNSITFCEDSLATNCIVSWRTFGKFGQPNKLQQYLFMNLYGDTLEQSLGKRIECTNPLTWKTSQEVAPKSLNKGIVPSTLRSKKRKARETCNAQIVEGVLIIKGYNSIAYNEPGHNYHRLDYNFFYYNIKENAAARVRHFYLNK